MGKDNSQMAGEMQMSEDIFKIREALAEKHSPLPNMGQTSFREGFNECHKVMDKKVKELRELVEYVLRGGIGISQEWHDRAKKLLRDVK
jgi:hypothetical protein